MKIAITHNHAEHQKIRCELIRRGLEKHGFSPLVAANGSFDGKVDLLIVWGDRMRQKYAHRAENTLVMERAYFEDRFHWVSLGFNGLNGWADFVNKNSPSDRWNKYFNDGRLKPWTTGDYFLLTLQIPGDASLTGNTITYANIVEKLREFNIPILVRKHPQRPREPGIRYDTLVQAADTNIPITELAEKAKATITISSNTGVDSILAGTPVLNFSNCSMVWDLAMKKYEELHNPWMPDRTQWCYDMAYTQWLPEELENGDAWDHLKSYYN